MVNAGCIVFVPNGGGQLEIVDDAALVYNDDADAVDKIEAMLKSEAEQKRVRCRLAQNAARFSPEIFQSHSVTQSAILLRSPERKSERRVRSLRDDGRAKL